MTKNRLEAFSDGVFAIAITLLVIDLRAPAHVPPGRLAHDLWWNLWPNYLAYAISFLVIGVMWLNHHRMIDPVQWVDTPLLLLNLHLLLWTALLPFPTSVVAEHLRDGGSNAKVAMALYGFVVLGAAVAFVCLFGWLTRDERILGSLPPKPEVRRARQRFGLGVLVYSVALALSFVSPLLALLMHAAMALYYAFDQSAVAARPGDEG
ncbi:MAG: DUF1211 domain-containing protein [Acidimicrobiia bacterium]|nr:DUF1211 domain-containing protein [Acidimicrobiia bacterium]